jgi:hypothetical protein
VILLPLTSHQKIYMHFSLFTMRTTPPRPYNPSWFKRPNNILRRVQIADHSGRAVLDMNCLRPLKHRDRGFESTWSIDICVRLFCLCSSVCR